MAEDDAPMNAEQIARRGPSRPRLLKPTPCYACSMPAQIACEFPGCALPLCAKHTIRKFGGHLCKQHEHATLVQHKSEPHPHEADAFTSKPSTRFRDAGEAKPHGLDI